MNQAVCLLTKLNDQFRGQFGQEVEDGFLFFFVQFIKGFLCRCSTVVPPQSGQPAFVRVAQRIQHHLLMIAEQHGDVLPCHDVQQDFDAVRAAVDGVTQHVKMVAVAELDLFQDVPVFIPAAVYIRHDVNHKQSLPFIVFLHEEIVQYINCRKVNGDLTAVFLPTDGFIDIIVKPPGDVPCFIVHLHRKNIQEG